MKHMPHTFGNIARRTAFSFFLFAMVLAALLTLSWYVLVPELTRVEVRGNVFGISELKSYKHDLESQIFALEGERSSYLLPVDDDLYERLKSLKKDRTKYQELRTAITKVVQDMFPDRRDIIQITNFHFNGATSIAEIRGSVRNVGPRSMTVLAEFVEAIDRIPMIISIESSRYVRQENEDGTFYSPFTIHLKIR